jgi:hypothetical protein
MQKQDKGKQKPEAEHAEENPLRKTRQDLGRQVAQLKQDIQRIQQQSLAEMMKVIQQTFHTGVTENLEDVAKQESDTLSNVAKAMQEAERKNADALQHFGKGKISEPDPVQLDIPTGTSRAVETQKLVDQAMLNATNSISATEKLLSYLPGANPQQPDKH